MTGASQAAALSPLLRQPPANLEAEQGLLGAVLANPRAYHSVSPFLRPDHFVDPLHGRIYAEAERRILAGGRADPIGLKAWFESDPMAGDVGSAYLAGLLGATVGIGAARDYGRAVYETWQRRRLIEIGEEVMSRAYGQDGRPEDLLAGALAAMESAFAADAERPALSLDEAMDAALAAADEAARRQGPAGVSTGFRSIDEQIGGLEPDTLNVLAGRPGQGKSGLGMQIAINAARAGVGVLAVSLEMSARELGRRALAVASRVPIWLIKRGTYGTADAEQMTLARRELAGLPLTIEDGPGLTAQQIDLRARRAARKRGLGLILIDHLHIVRPEDRDVRQGATWAVGRVSGAMKRLAKAHRCPVLLLAQLNRGVEGRDDKRPGLADLRQAGDIEQDADTVSFLYRAEYYLRREPERREGEPDGHFEGRIADWHSARERVRGKADLIVEKIRDGSPGVVPLQFHSDTASFSEWPHG